MKFFKALLISHASYILITAIWPLVHIKSFMEVTGYKSDVWLVKTVGALLIPIALCMLSYARIRGEKIPVIILASCTAISFIAIDCYYALTDVISDIYLADAVVEAIFLSGWVYSIRKPKEQLSKS
jgi:hypothetical protein